jgi:hypothetical protein
MVPVTVSATAAAIALAKAMNVANRSAVRISGACLSKPQENSVSDRE